MFLLFLVHSIFVYLFLKYYSIVYLDLLVFWFLYVFINGDSPPVKGFFWIGWYIFWFWYSICICCCISFCVSCSGVFSCVSCCESVCWGTSSLSDCVSLSSVCCDSWSCCKSSLYDCVSSSDVYRFISCVFKNSSDCPYSMTSCSCCSVGCES